MTLRYILCCVGNDGNEISGYDEDQLTFIEHVEKAGIKAVKRDKAIKRKTESNLKWIVNNWNKMKAKNQISNFSLEHLMSLIGIANQRKKHGESYTYYMNRRNTFLLFDAVLSTGDLEAVKAFIAKGQENLKKGATCLNQKM